MPLNLKSNEHEIAAKNEKEEIMKICSYFLLLSNRSGTFDLKVWLLLYEKLFRNVLSWKHLTCLEQREKCYHYDFYQKKNLTALYARKLPLILTSSNFIPMK